MDGVIDEAADRRLLDATLKYVAGHADARFDAFREAMADWGEDRTDVASAHLRASDLFADALPLARRGTAERALMTLYVKERASRRWEQSYSAADAAVGADMLAGYGYTEIVGKRGPFLSERIRAGVGVFAAGVDYPAHRHRAEEIYVVLAGSGTFHLDGHPPERQVAGGVVHVPSHLVHGITVDTEPLAVLCLWRGGDLREKFHLRPSRRAGPRRTGPPTDAFRQRPQTCFPARGSAPMSPSHGCADRYQTWRFGASRSRWRTVPPRMLIRPGSSPSSQAQSCVPQVAQNAITRRLPLSAVFT